MRGLICSSVTALCLSLGAYAQVPPTLHGTYAEVDTTLASTEKFRGLEVRWGGVISGRRLTDSGECAEVSWYPLDRSNAKPRLGRILGSRSAGTSVAPSTTPQLAPVSVGYRVYGSIYPMDGEGNQAAAPRFLACGGAIQDQNAYFTGAVVTLAGVIQPSGVFEVEPPDCLRGVAGVAAAEAIYASNVIVTQDETCVVSLPTIRITDARSWKPQPSFDRNSSSVFNGH